MPKILLKFSGTVLKEILIDKDQLTVGRKLDNDLVIDNLAISGHHARIFKENGIYFIEDLGSTNGTFLNESKIDKRRLQHGDEIRIGKHFVVFQDDTTVTSTGRTGAVPFVDLDKTVVATPQQKDLLRGKSGKGLDDTLLGGKVGVLLVVSGQTDKNEYRLPSRISIIGSQDSAAVKLTGWFAPKVAALISRHDAGYSISMSEEAKKILVNGTIIQGRCELKDGDLIEVANVKMYFYMRHPTTS